MGNQNKTEENPITDGSSVRKEISDKNFLSSLFLGAYGENRKLLTQLLSEFIGEHFNWRRDYYSEDSTCFNQSMPISEEYQSVVEKTRYELHSLTEKLKHTAPTFNPRYLGHMSSDLLLPSLLAQLVTTIYNPNNSQSDIGKTTIKMELDVGNQFAKLFGYNTDSDIYPCAWGHVTSGGSDANYEALWNYRAVKYYPVAIVEALNLMRINIKLKKEESKKLGLKDPLEYSPWELVNLTIDQVLNLRKVVFNKIKNELGVEVLKKFYRTVEDNRLESIGPAQFFAEHYRCHQPVVLVPATAYRFWKKAMRLLGFGSASLIEIPVDRQMRCDPRELKRIIERLSQQNIPVLAVIGVLGTRNFGSVDPIHEIVKLRDESIEKGSCFFIHADASFGGYLKTIMTDSSGRSIPRMDLLNCKSSFPSESVYQSFTALNKADSITVAPHTLGYLPQGIGVFIARNREIVKLLNPNERNLLENGDKLDLTQLGRYILDGSKPGANATAAYVTHKVLPLHSEAFGKIMKLGITTGEKLYKKLTERFKSHQRVNLSIPVIPDSNIVCITVNPKENSSFDKNRKFMSDLSKRMISEDKCVQDKPFLSSVSRLKLSYFSEEETQKLFKEMGLELTDSINLNEEHLIIIRHTLNNPWLSINEDTEELLEAYCEFLDKEITKSLESIRN